MYTVIDGPYTQAGTNELKDILGDGKAFTFPKPSGLILHLLKHLHQDKDAIVLDFFRRQRHHRPCCDEAQR